MTKEQDNALAAQMDISCKEDNVFTLPWESTRHVRDTAQEDFAKDVHWDSTFQVSDALK